ncbi:hypothetical protein FQA47_018772 [Oryzias melastigma]|uniref:Uncharacterized protein n=1 Tax=Oryzias melastigma TaxID=30732 RepID=A0A834C6M4_ORYME|nr:hypothetical protein FQA47_018772 [Oryzias melastigma]
MALSHPPLSALLLTCLGEIPMQLPILYSMSSSGEVTLALHGWQSTFLQNCIVNPDAASQIYSSYGVRSPLPA